MKGDKAGTRLRRSHVIINSEERFEKKNVLKMRSLVAKENNHGNRKKIDDMSSKSCL